jgi:hypothetical protein
MNKTLLLFFLSLAFVSQSQNHVISFGVGVPNLYKAAFLIADNGSEIKYKGLGPIHLKYENRIHDRIGIGLSINHVRYQFDFKDQYLDTNQGRILVNDIRIKGQNTAFNAKLNFHYLKQEGNVDLYSGFGLGLKFGKPKVTATYEDSKPKITFPNLSIIGAEFTLIGIRTYFTENIGAYVELGIAKSIVQAGLSIRFD